MVPAHAPTLFYPTGLPGTNRDGVVLVTYVVDSTGHLDERSLVVRFANQQRFRAP